MAPGIIASRNPLASRIAAGIPGPKRNVQVRLRQPAHPNGSPYLDVAVASKAARRAPGSGCAGCMRRIDWEPRRPFDLRERLFDFALLTIRIVQFLHTRGPVAVALSYQLLKCGTSAGANYEEADAGSSTRDSVAKKKIALREMKESKWRLRLLRRAGFLTAEHDPVLRESDELSRILGAIIRNDENGR